MEKKVPAKKPAVRTAAKKTATVRTAAPVKKVAAPKKVEVSAERIVLDLPKEGMIKTLGRRKEAVAQVRVNHGTGKIVVNGKAYDSYFSVPEMQWSIVAPLKATGMDGKIDASVLVKGGGIRGQADATRLGISRALIEMTPTFRPTLRKMGFLTRDARVKERKKYGLKSARRAPQFSKR